MNTNNSLTTAEIEKQLLIQVHQFLSEMEAERAKLALTLDASLERDLGLGSLEKAELFRRLEKIFSIRFPSSLLAQANTLQDLVIAIQAAKPSISITTQEIPITLEAIKVDVSKCETLVNVLQQYVKEAPNRPHIYLQDEEGNETVIRYGQLYENALSVAKGLAKEGLKPTETVAIMVPTTADFFYAFFGVLLAGGVPVPIYPPFRPDQIEDYAKREAIILRNAEVRVLITFQRAEGLSKILRDFIPSLVDVTTVTELQKMGGKLREIFVAKNDAALIQYTSGSTGNPKGVLLTHANLLANIRAYGEGIGLGPKDVVVTWLPLYHDMGLIGTWLGSLYYGLPAVIMSPLSFLTHPARWLWTIHAHRGTLSAGPNFAYELCVRKIDDASLEGLDLSSWRLAFNGAEAIYPKTLESFTKRFAKYGLKKETLFPVYGLAETCVALTFPEPGRPFKIDYVAREPFETEGKAIPFNADEKNSLAFVCCGKPLGKHEIRIVDEKDQLLPERRVGSLHFRGPSSMQGYYRNPEASRAIFHGDWINSGDLAYIAEGEVYITGRKKDVIIKAGRNIYPPEIEEIVNHVEGVRKGCAVAFGARDLERGTEKFVIVAETVAKDPKEREKIIADINEKVAEVLRLPPDQVILVPPRTIPKTSSGKLRRSSTLELYQKGTLEKHGMPTWLQMTRLFLTGQSKKSWRWLGKVGKFFYTVYIWFIFTITVLPLWAAIYLIPRNKTGKLIHFWARLILRLAGIPVSVSGQENLLKEGGIFAANHASYVDSIVLLATLPPNFSFVGKKELLSWPLIGSFVKKLNYITVDRLDLEQSLADTKQIQQALENKQSILIFPEGTFTYATGLRPFKLGAFKVAVETKMPILPIALAGTRSILRGNTYLFRPGMVKVHFSKAVMPQSQEWSEVIRLRNATRLEISKYCGEPTLDLIRAGLEES